MPHLSLQASKNTVINDRTALLNTLAQALFDTGHFAHFADIKTRLFVADDSLVGGGTGEFIHAHLELMAGRTDLIKHALSELILDTLQQQLGKDNANMQYSVDLHELSPYYKKAVVQP